MSGRSKKFGGIKKRQGATPAADVVDSVPPRKFGGVKEPAARGGSSVVESCLQNCPGEWIEGMWIHSYDCPWVAVLWFAHGADWKDWRCPYDCDPIELPSGLTHPYTCPFWDRTGKTPFDHEAPHGVIEPTQFRTIREKEEQKFNVAQQKERIRRGETKEINSEEILRELFPEENDDLPF